MPRPIQKNKAARAPKAPAICRATVLEILSSGEILVEIPGKPAQRMLCDFLQSATNNQLVLLPGDPVIIQPATAPAEKGCVLGKIGPYREPQTRNVEISADEELTIRCGEGSITLRKTGQILIKGLDIVSRAKRNQRIRGGSIQLN